MNQVLIQPKLRFEKYNSEWHLVTLGSVAKIERGRFSPRPRNDPQFYGGDIPFAQTSDVSLSNGYIKYHSQTLNEKGLKVSKLFPEGTILMTIAANIGYCGLLSKAMACPDSLVGIRCKKGTNNHFLNAYLNREQPRVDYLAPQAAQKNINIEFLEPYKICLPTDETEQQKIASFLMSVDSKISQLTEKYRLLKEYKKGVMQQIFSQQLRFKDKDGKDFPEWKYKPLSYLLLEHKCRNKEQKFGKKDVLSVSGELGVVNQIKHLGRSYAGESVAPYHIVHEGDIVYTKSPLKNNPYGIIKANLGRAGIVSTLYAVYSCKKTAYPKYLNYYFSLNDNVNRYLRPLVHKGAKNDMKINNQRVLIDPIYFPCYNEQIKISNFFEALDTKIRHTQNQIKKTKQFKQGLLQQMFV